MSKDIGDVAEAECLVQFLRAGCEVSTPFGDNYRYDLVVKLAGVLQRVQVKSGRIKEGVVVADMCSSYRHRGRGAKDYRGDIECFAIWCPDNQKMYVVPVDEAPLTRISLRLVRAANRQSVGIRPAIDYEFPKITTEQAVNMVEKITMGLAPR